MLKKCYINKRVLVTGHTGFKGAWLCLWLKDLGADVVGLALEPPSKPNLFEEAGVADCVQDYRCDIRDFNETLNTMKQVMPEIIFHLAAQPIVRDSYSVPVETFSTNTMGAIHVFECARQVQSVRALVHVSSDKCYRNDGQNTPFVEADSMGGQDPYSASKAAAEVAFSAYMDSYFNKQVRINAASARAGNVIGGGDWAKDRLIPDAIRAWSQSKQLSVRNPHSIRPWQHVLDALHGYLVVGQHLLTGDKSYSGSWNIGPASESIKCVADVLDSLVVCWPNAQWTYQKDIDGLDEASVLTLACQKAISELGWAPVWDFHEAIEHTAHWYKSYYTGHSAFDLCMQDIDDFMKKGMS